jgi:hypothetical protein
VLEAGPRGDGIALRLGSMVLELGRADAERLHEVIGRALMPGQPAAQCIRLNCGHPQARHDGSRPGAPCEDCGCQGWTPAAGAASGVSPGMICEMEAGRKGCSLRVAHALATALGATVDAMLRADDQEAVARA